MVSHDFDVVCVGNAKIDTFLTLHEANSHLRLLEETNELCIKFGEKIAVDKAEILLGGNAANVSVGTSRLGLATAIVAEIGKDEFAQKIITTLSKENVNTEKVSQTKDQQSSFSTIINYRGERTIFSEHVKRLHDFNQKTVDFVKKTGCRLAFNPGTLQIENGKDNLQNVLLVTNLLFVNKEEAEELLRYPHGQKSIQDLIVNLQKLGPKIVVITDGKNGSFAIDEKGNISKKDIIQTEVIEKTGAGDAYSSGFLSALIYNQSISDSMNWGTKNSVSVISKIGAQAGLLYKTNFKND